MRLKSFTAASLALALEMVRKELGEEAIIVSTQPGAGGRGARVTAALDEPAEEAGGAAPSGRSASTTATGLADVLRGHGLSSPLVDHLLKTAGDFADEEPALALAAGIDELFAFQPIVERAQRRPLLLVGPPGAGKTLVVAKLMMRAIKSGRGVRAISSDTFRAGGLEQLEAFARILEVELAPVDGPAALMALIDPADERLVVIDTAGANPFAAADLRALEALAEVAEAEPVLVLPAGLDPGEAADIARGFAEIGARRMVATRVDISRRLGNLLMAAEAAGLAFADIGLSPHVADGLTPVNPLSLARLLLPGDVEVSLPAPAAAIPDARRQAATAPAGARDPAAPPVLTAPARPAGDTAPREGPVREGPVRPDLKRPEFPRIDPARVDPKRREKREVADDRRPVTAPRPGSRRETA